MLTNSHLLLRYLYAAKDSRNYWLFDISIWRPQMHPKLKNSESNSLMSLSNMQIWSPLPVFLAQWMASSIHSAARNLGMILDMPHTHTSHPFYHQLCYLYFANVSNIDPLIFITYSETVLTYKLIEWNSWIIFKGFKSISPKEVKKQKKIRNIKWMGQIVKG